MARPARKSTATAKKPASYQFEMLPVVVVTPLALTHFMCLAEINEVTGKFGGSLLFTDEDLDQEVNFKEWTTKEKWKDGFFEGVDAMINEALEEYNSNNKKQATRADKFLTHFDKEDNETDLWEFKIKNNDQPKIVDKHKQRIPEFDELIGNGSQVKVQVNLKPYFMQGKVGVTAYVDYVLIKEIVEYGGGAGGIPFDDDDFDDDANEIDEPEYEEEEAEPEPAKPTRKARKKATPPPAEEEPEEEEAEPEAEPVKPKRTRRSKAQIQADKDAEADAVSQEEADEPEPEVKPARKKRTVKKDVAEPSETTDNEAEAEPEVKPTRKRRIRATKAPAEAEVQGEDDDF